MPRTRTSLGVHDYRFFSQSSPARIEAINQQLIKAEICDNHKAIVRRERNSVSVRPFLPLGIYARTLVLNKRRSLAYPAVCHHGQHRHATQSVIRDQRVLASSIKSNVSRTFVARGDLV